MITFHLITLFPESFESYLNASIVKRAQVEGKIAIKYYNPRDFVEASKKGAVLTYADRRVDNRPYGGGPGMVIEALPIIKAIECAVGKKLKAGSVGTKNAGKKIKGSTAKLISKKVLKNNVKIVFFSPAGEQFTNLIAEDYKQYSDIVMICGRYEGIDARIKEVFPMVDITVGPYVLTGGELPAMILIDCISRQIPGVLGKYESLEEERISSSEVYTRPEVLKYKNKNYKVPKVLLSGNHKLIDEWKLNKK